jgi:hypothetical protein
VLATHLDHTNEKKKKKTRSKSYIM